MNLTREQITIAVTVYTRRKYVKQAIASALDQTLPVRVMVVEDCGPDATLADFVKEEFGSRIAYFRSPKRRGIFGNWNACLEQCRTEWLSILHDDDFLAPNFIASMLKLAEQAPGLDLYCGHAVALNEENEPTSTGQTPPVPKPWIKIDLKTMLYSAPFYFPGQIIQVPSAKAVGGFRATSYCCGDWEMWTKLTTRGGAAQTSDLVASYRVHDGWDKGLNQLYRNGKQFPAAVIQHKRILALLPPADRVKFDRAEWVRRSQTSVFFLLERGVFLSPRLLRYHVKMMLLSPPPNWRYAFFQQLARLFGPGLVKAASAVWSRLRPAKGGGRFKQKD